MINPFEEQGYLLPLASLNNLPIAPTGMTAKDVCSTNAVLHQIADYLHLPKDISATDWPLHFAKSLKMPATSAQATAVVEHIAQNLSQLLWTLKQGINHPSIQNRYPNWNSEHWAYWASIDCIHLAGGLLNGTLGTALLPILQTKLRASVFPQVHLSLVRYPAIISLLGAAKYASCLCERALIFDFGHSYIKQGYFSQCDGNLKLHTFCPVPALYTQYEYDTSQAERQAAKKLSDFIIQTIVNLFQTVTAQGLPVCNTIIISIANYVNNGLFASRAGYGKLNLVYMPYSDFLSDALFESTGQRFNIEFLHDGTAGAYAAQNHPLQHEAFIAMGTSLSVGFPSSQMDFDFPCEIINE